MAQSRTRYVGMEVQKASRAVAAVAQDHGADVISLGTVGTRQGEIDTRIRPLQSQSQPRVCVFAAGPGGACLSRSLTKQGHGCWGVAPALLPQKSGDRVNTDRRDALQWARLLRAGDRTPVSVPAGHDAAMRDLSRARDETLHALKTAQGRLTAFLLRHDSRDTGRATWGPAPLRWRREVVCPTPAQPIVFPA
jgi:transposase